jgi:hypothetical protein
MAHARDAGIGHKKRRAMVVGLGVEGLYERHFVHVL